MPNKPLTIMIPEPGYDGRCNSRCPLLYGDPDSGNICVLGLGRGHTSWKNPFPSKGCPQLKLLGHKLESYDATRIQSQKAIANAKLHEIGCNSALAIVYVMILVCVFFLFCLICQFLHLISASA
jgi:hypothetical protein